MRIVNLCEKGCCPRVEICADFVRIGEEDNTCTLKKGEWASLREKVLKGEL
ncbi:MAG: hypothetical protein QF829_03445 [Candidatus Hydrothermarchaeota archaeon]|nr:hypothetical protein [Candidatus Hydrothermarchaeota archaeon]